MKTRSLKIDSSTPPVVAEFKEGCYLEQLAGPAKDWKPCLLHALIDLMPALVAAQDRHGKYVFANRSFASAAQRSLASIIGKTNAEIFPAGGAPSGFEAALRNAFQTQPQQKHIRSADGLRTFVCRQFPIGDPHTGEPVAFGNLAIDVTELEAVSQQLAMEHAVARVLSTAGSVEEASPRLLEALCRKLNCAAGRMWTVDAAAGVLRLRETWHAATFPVGDWLDNDGRPTCPSGAGLPGRIWAERRPMWIDNAWHSTEFVCEESIPPEGLNFAFGFPLHCQDQVLGVIDFFSRTLSAVPSESPEILDALGNQIGQFIERQAAQRQLQERNLELQIARRIQENLLPKRMPQLPGHQIAAACVPAKETGGDLLEVVPLGPDRFLLGVGDASGHGVGAALLMATTHAYLRALTLQHSDPATILRGVNQALSADGFTDQFVTLFLATIDAAGGMLQFANAGHLPGIVLDVRGEQRSVLASTSLPLGVDEHASIEAGHPVTLRSGDTVVLYSDGIVEALNREHGQYGMDRMLRCLHKNVHRPAAEMIDTVLADVLTFSQGVQHDDRTMLILRKC